MSTLILAGAVAIVAAILVPLLLRDTARAEQRARYRALTRPLRRSFEGFAASLGVALMPAMQRAVAATIDMQDSMRKPAVTLTVRALGWTFHVELATDQPDTGYDHDVATTTLDAEPCGDVAMGFTPGWVGE